MTVDKDKMPVLYALLHLVKFKKATTLAEIARVCNKKQLDALEVLNANLGLLVRDNKMRVTGIKDFRSIIVGRMYAAGQVYRLEPINYGCTTTLAFHGHDELRERMQTKVCCGGLGDSYVVTVVVDTPENRKALEDAGMVLNTDVPAPDDPAVLWKE